MSEIYLFSYKFHKNQQLGKREQPDQCFLLRKGSYILAPSHLCWAAASWSMSVHIRHWLDRRHTWSCGSIMTHMSIVWLIRMLGDKWVKKSRTVYRKPGITFQQLMEQCYFSSNQDVMFCSLSTDVHSKSFQIFQLENIMVRWFYMRASKVPLELLLWF